MRKEEIFSVIRRLKEEGIKYMIVGSAALLLNGYNIQPHDLDLVVRKEDYERAKEILGDKGDVYVGDPKKELPTPEEYRDWFLRHFMFDDLEIQKLAKHAVEDPRILDLFKDTEIMFVLEHYYKQLKEKQ
jgi:hypothetical protein